MAPSSLEYRQTRAAIRDASVRALDYLDGLHSALVHGDAPRARSEARLLALVADDLGALLDRVCRLTAHHLADTERYAPGVK